MSVPEHPTCHEAPLANREMVRGQKWRVLPEVSIWVYLVMCLPALLQCWVFADRASQETRTLPFISNFLWAQVLQYGVNSVSKCYTALNLSEVAPGAAGPAASIRSWCGLKTLITYLNKKKKKRLTQSTDELFFHMFTIPPFIHNLLNKYSWITNIGNDEAKPWKIY